MTLVALASLFLRVHAYLELFVALLLVLPLLVAGFLTLFRWPNPWLPMRILNWGLVAVLPIGALIASLSILWRADGIGAGIMIVLFSLLILALIWFPQVAAVLICFHTPPRQKSE